jgi:hypothetical protein
MKSYSEGVVRRVDVTASEGHFFVVEVTHEVILDRQLRIRPGFQGSVAALNLARPELRQERAERGWR